MGLVDKKKIKDFQQKQNYQEGVWMSSTGQSTGNDGSALIDALS